MFSNMISDKLGLALALPLYNRSYVRDLALRGTLFLWADAAIIICINSNMNILQRLKLVSRF